MNSQEYLDMMNSIYEKILNFLEEEVSSDKNLLLKDIFNNTKINDNKYNLLSFLHLISKISDNRCRFTNFFSKIERIFQIFKEDIKKYFSNSEIFNIFKSNKRILLIIIEQQIIVFDEYIAKKITKTSKYIKAKYPHYFQPELQPFIDEKWFPKYDPEIPELKINEWVEEINEVLPENFYEKRKEGENDSKICELIRKDMISEFVEYVTRNNVSLNSKIQPSIYETNSFLLKDKKKSNPNLNSSQKNVGFSLIEYAAFFGSLKILKYLCFKGVQLTQSLLPLVIHSKNVKIIHFLKDNQVELDDESCKQAFYESIKCHHNDIANYFINNILQNDEENSQDTINQCLKYYNVAFLKNEFINESSFCNLCKYYYCAIVDYLLKNKEIDVNKIEIFNIMFI